MNSLDRLKSLRNEMFASARKYRQSVIANLKEIDRELDVVSDYWDEDYPKGLKVTSLNDDNEAFSCVVDKIRYDESEPCEKASIHVVWYNDDKIDQWWGLNELISEAADYVLSCIVWEQLNKELKEVKEMKRDKEYDKLIDAADVVCGVCECRSEYMCENCPVRITINNYYKEPKKK